MFHKLRQVRVLKLTSMQNLRDEVAMDVDEDEQGTQRVKRVPDYGIEVDFDSLSDADRNVRCLTLSRGETNWVVVGCFGRRAQGHRRLDREECSRD